jgi:epoxyqueuosine reductase
MLEAPDLAYVSRYALGRDYHKIMRSSLARLGETVMREFGPFGFRVCVDSAPVLEKALARNAGLGWIGKHTNLLSRDAGSLFFLGEILTDLPLPADEPVTAHCGTCTACITVCPTQAIVAPWRLDSRRCISYLTIENDGPIPEEFRVAIGNRIYGCDDCLAVCPWNKFASEGREAKLAARDSLRAPRLADLSRLDDAQFRALFSKTAIKRTGRDRFVRNVLIAIGNSGEANLAVEAERLLKDASPLVRGAAVWALSQLLPRTTLVILAQQYPDHDPSVREEWTAALG